MGRRSVRGIGVDTVIDLKKLANCFRGRVTNIGQLRGGFIIRRLAHTDKVLAFAVFSRQGAVAVSSKVNLVGGCAVEPTATRLEGLSVMVSFY